MVKDALVLVHPLIATRRLENKKGSDPSLRCIMVCLLNGNKVCASKEGPWLCSKVFQTWLYDQPPEMKT